MVILVLLLIIAIVSFVPGFYQFIVDIFNFLLV